MAERLRGLGVIKFEQIANFSDDDIANVDEALALEGRIEKDDWVGQAQRLLAEAAASEVPAGEGEKKKRRNRALARIAPKCACNGAIPPDSSPGSLLRPTL